MRVVPRYYVYLNVRMLSVDNLSVLVFVFVADTFFVGRHGTKAHADVREATIVVEILHGYLLR